MNYLADSNRYAEMMYRRCGKSGLKLPAISLGLWHNFGRTDNLKTCRDILTCAFDNGITYFDLANNYGPPPGSAEENFGKMVSDNFKAYRDELVIATKAGYTMWNGPYGDWGSKKYLVSSLDQSLKRMKLDYVDIFYHHRPDLETPLEETMSALDLIVRQGKALYVGLSNYKTTEGVKAMTLLHRLGTPCIIHQPKYSMFERWVEDGLLELLAKEDVGCIPFSPLAQGMLTDRYLNGIPEDSRVAKGVGFLTPDHLTPDRIDTIEKLNHLAIERRQKLSQMALSWILKDRRIPSVLIGASRTQQVLDAVHCLDNMDFTSDELNKIESILK
jgi:L-glyceraldehyde 3-phosphate reductase